MSYIERERHICILNIHRCVVVYSRVSLLERGSDVSTMHKPQQMTKGKTDVDSSTLWRDTPWRLHVLWTLPPDGPVAVTAQWVRSRQLRAGSVSVRWNVNMMLQRPLQSRTPPQPAHPCPNLNCTSPGTNIQLQYVTFMTRFYFQISNSYRLIKIL